MLAITTNYLLRQFNFIVTQVCALTLAVIYRKVFDYERVSYNVRVLACLIPGVALSTFCYGR